MWNKLKKILIAFIALLIMVIYVKNNVYAETNPSSTYSCFYDWMKQGFTKYVENNTGVKDNKKLLDLKYHKDRSKTEPNKTIEYYLYGEGKIMWTRSEK